MKRIVLPFAALVLLSLVSIMSVAQNNTKLPRDARNLISSHFKGYTINHVEDDVDFLKTEYKVYVGNKRASFKLEFDSKGKLIGMASLDKKTALPNSLVPLKISQYVKDVYPNTNIIEWEMERRTQTVELENRLEMVFSKSGDFLRIDY